MFEYGQHFPELNTLQYKHNLQNSRRKMTITIEQLSTQNDKHARIARQCLFSYFYFILSLRLQSSYAKISHTHCTTK